MPPGDEHGGTGARPAGRPRSPETHDAILRATVDVLAEQSFDAMTIEGVAKRAGVGKGAIYRRWSSKEGLLVDAVARFVEEIEIPDTGSVAGDLLHLMEDAVAVYRGKPGRIIPGLVSALASSEELAGALRSTFLHPRRARLRAVLERGVARGELDPGLDFELALDFLGGPLFYRLLITGGPLDGALARGVVDVMLYGIGRSRPGRDGHHPHLTHPPRCEDER